MVPVCGAISIWGTGNGTSRSNSKEIRACRRRTFSGFSGNLSGERNINRETRKRKEREKKNGRNAGSLGRRERRCGGSSHGEHWIGRLCTAGVEGDCKAFSLASTYNCHRRMASSVGVALASTQTTVRFSFRIHQKRRRQVTVHPI